MHAGHDVYVEALLKVRVRLSLVTVAGVYLAVLCVILEPVCFCLAMALLCCVSHSLFCVPNCMNCHGLAVLTLCVT